MSKSPLIRRGWAKSKTLPPTAARRSLRVISAVFVAALVAAVGAGQASAHSGPKSAQSVTGSDANGTYLALGDSVAFGYVPPHAVPAPNYFDAHSFVGYPEYLAEQLNVHVANASCPGETTASLLNPSAQSNGCENSFDPVLGSLPVGYSTFYPLHVEYQGSQMAYALHYLADHKHTRLITIDIGANDYFLCQAMNGGTCSTPSELFGLATEIATNLGTIFYDLRDVAGYTGPIVVLDYYSLDYSGDLTSNATYQAAVGLDSLIASVATAPGNDGIVADGLGAFAARSIAAGGTPCAAGLLIPVPAQYASAPGGCNIHPTATGQQLLAGAIVTALKNAGYLSEVARS